MANLTAAQALKVLDISKATLYRDINSGKVSVDIDEKGRKVIDTSELIRAYGELKSPETNETVSRNSSMKPRETDETVSFLKQEIEFLKRENKQLEEDREERRERERELREIIKNQTLLLPKPEEPQPRPQQKPKSLSWQNAILIGGGIVITGALAFVAWVF